MYAYVCACMYVYMRAQTVANVLNQRARAKLTTARANTASTFEVCMKRFSILKTAHILN